MENAQSAILPPTVFRLAVGRASLALIIQLILGTNGVKKPAKKRHKHKISTVDAYPLNIKKMTSAAIADAL